MQARNLNAIRQTLEEHGIEFLDLNGVRLLAHAERDEQARRLALQCREDATKAGISSHALEATVNGDLVGNMLEALDAAEFRQTCRDQWADQEGGA